MEIYRILFVVFFIVSIFVMTIFITVSSFLYERNNSKKYNFLNGFMFEINNFRRYNKQSWLSLTCLILIMLLFISPSIFFILYGKGSLVYQIILILFSVISSGSMFALFFIKLSNYKLHIAFNSVFAISNLISIVLSTFFLGSGDTYGFIYSSEFSKVLIVILGIIFVILEALLMLNPTYKNWDRMVKVDASIYSRPKYCYLSILEWGSVIIYLLSLSLPLISLFA